MDEYRRSMEHEEAESDNPEPPERQGEQTPEDETEEPIKWDGSEAELVADDAAEYEEQQTGIKLSYILRQNEIVEGLKKSGFCKTTGKRAIIESVILAASAVLFLFTYFMKNDARSLPISIICVLLIAVIWIVPQQGMKNRAKQLADGKEIHMEIYPDSIVTGEGEDRQEIPLDGSCEFEQHRNLYLIYYKNQTVILPLRSVEPAVMPEIQAMIISGTTPKQY